MNNQGFSFLETTVVAAISSTLLYVALSASFNPTSQVKEKVQAQAVRQALIQARNAARFEIQCVAVQVQAHSLDVSRYSSCPPSASTLIGTRTIQFSPVISLAAFDTGNPLIFNPQGGTTAAAPSTMNINAVSGQSFSHTVYPAIGAISSR